MAKETILNKALTLMVVFMIIAVLIYKLLAFNGKDSPKPVTEKSWPVRVAVVPKTQASPQIILYGQVESPKQATLASTLDTSVVKVFVKEGDIVKKGTLLVKLDAEEFNIIAQQKKAAVDEVKSQIKTELIEYKNDLKSQKYLEKLVNTNQIMMKRLEKLQARHLEAQSNVDKALNALLLQQINFVKKQTEIDNHEHHLAELKAKERRFDAAYQHALLDVEKTQIVAPFDGRITEVFVSQGDNIVPSSKLVSLYNLNDVEIRAQLPQKYLSVIINALKYTDSLKAVMYSPQKIELDALRTGGELKKGSSTIDIFFKIPKENLAQLPLNLTVKLYLQLPKVKEVYVIPATSLYGKSRIYQVKNQRLHSINVQMIGETYANDQLYYLIQHDKLPNKLEVLDSKLPNARDGLKVVPSEEAY